MSQLPDDRMHIGIQVNRPDGYQVSFDNTGGYLFERNRLGIHAIAPDGRQASVQIGLPESLDDVESALARGIDGLIELMEATK